MLSLPMPAKLESVSAFHHEFPQPNATMEADISAYLSARMSVGEGSKMTPLDEFFAREFPIATRKIGLKTTDGTPPRTAIFRYRLGDARLLAFERNIVWQMSEDLKQKGGNEALEKPVDFEAKLIAPAHIYDLRSGKYLGQSDRIAVHLDPWQPSLFALLPQRIPGDDALAALTKLAAAAR